MKELINADGSINVHDEFFIPASDNRLKVTGTTKGNSIWDCLDTIKNLDFDHSKENGKKTEYTEMTREKLRQLKPYIND
jgi:hypothetical protein